MRKITLNQARLLAQDYIQNTERKFLVYNIRTRTYRFHDTYRYYYRFSRRQSVWNTRLFDIEDYIEKGSLNENHITQTILNVINRMVDDIVQFKYKSHFTLEASYEMLHYYFESKCYLAYYDYFLGCVVLIKERDKSNDFGELIGSRYHFLGDLHQIIQNQLDIDEDLLKSIIVDLNFTITPVQEIPGMDILNQKIHDYLLKEINHIEANLK